MENNFVDFDGVIILPFKKGIDGLPSSFGIIVDRNIKAGETLLNKEIDIEDENSLDCAIKMLEISTGYKIIDEYLWSYIGEITINSPIYGPSYSCYSVDISSITPFPEYIKNTNIDFRLVELSELVKKDDVCILSVLMKLYVSKFSKIFSIN